MADGALKPASKPKRIRRSSLVPSAKDSQEVPGMGVPATALANEDVMSDDDAYDLITTMWQVDRMPVSIEVLEQTAVWRQWMFLLFLCGCCDDSLTVFRPTAKVMQRRTSTTLVLAYVWRLLHVAAVAFFIAVKVAGLQVAGSQFYLNMIILVFWVVAAAASMWLGSDISEGHKVRVRICSTVCNTTRMQEKTRKQIEQMLAMNIVIASAIVAVGCLSLYLFMGKIEEQQEHYLAHPADSNGTATMAELALAHGHAVAQAIEQLPRLPPIIPVEHRRPDWLFPEWMGPWGKALFFLSGIITRFTLVGGILAISTLVSILRVRVVTAYRKLAQPDTTVRHAIDRLCDIDILNGHLGHKFSTPLTLIVGALSGVYVTTAFTIITNPYDTENRWVDPDVYTVDVVLGEFLFPVFLSLYFLAIAGSMNKAVTYLLIVCTRFEVGQRVHVKPRPKDYGEDDDGDDDDDGGKEKGEEKGKGKEKGKKKDKKKNKEGDDLKDDLKWFSNYYKKGTFHYMPSGSKLNMKDAWKFGVVMVFNWILLVRLKRWKFI